MARVLSNKEAELAAENCGLVLATIQRMRLNTNLFDEAVSAGMLGLVRSAQAFDPARGFRFSTLASRAIYREVLAAIKRELRFRQRFHDEWWRAVEETGGEGLMQPSPRRTPPAIDVCEQAGLAEELDRMRACLDRGTLTRRERMVVELRYLAGRTLQDVANRTGVTKEGVRQIEGRALSKLRKAMEMTNE
jgi:RNA polymerase sigma factor (sigma-70 family)